MHTSEKGVGWLGFLLMVTHSFIKYFLIIIITFIIINP